MVRAFGKVLEVFIPNQYDNGKFLDVMDRTIIGFKVLINNEIKELILEQTENNSAIYKDDFVMITKQIIDDREFIDIEKCDGDFDED